MPNDADSLTETDVDETTGETEPSPLDTAALTAEDAAALAAEDLTAPPGDDDPTLDRDAEFEAPPARSVYPDEQFRAAGSIDDADDPEFEAPPARSVYPDEDFDEDLDGDLDEDLELLFDGDPDDFELSVGGELVAARGGLLVLDEPIPAGGPAGPRQLTRSERRRRVRLQARRVRRVIRHVEPWSVLKISLVFYACLWVILLVAGFMIWGVAESSGTVDKLETLITDLFQLDTFDFNGGQVLRGYALGGLALAIAGTTFNVLMCLLFNLISDLTGGLRITMIEEETARPAPQKRRRRRPVDRSGGPPG